MRLRKTLCLLLALAMVFSLVLVGGAGATADAAPQAGTFRFTDAAQIQYREAVDVMAAIGVLTGDPGGAFRPTDNINRAEAAALVTRAVLGPTAAAALSGVTSTFSDVPATVNGQMAWGWAIPSIEFLVREGAISGFPDGTFRPADPITGHMIAAMLLGALGWGRHGEYTGVGWEMPVTIDALAAGIFDGNRDGNFAAPATREEASLYSFNALFADFVTWSTDRNAYISHARPGGGVIWPGGFFNLAEQVFGLPRAGLAGPVPARLVRDEDVDSFGRPATLWAYRGNDIGEYSDAPAFRFTTVTTAAAIETALRGWSFAANPVANTGAVFGNVNSDTLNTAWSVPQGAIDNARAQVVVDRTGNGTVVELFASHPDHPRRIDTIVVIQTGVLRASAQVPAATGAARRLNIGDNLIGIQPGDIPNFDVIFGTAAAAQTAHNLEGVPVLVVPAGGMAAIGALDHVDKLLADVVLARTERLTATSYSNTGANNTSSFVAGGTVYRYSQFAVNRLGWNNTGPGGVDFSGAARFRQVTAVFDTFGFVINVAPVEDAEPPVALVTNAAFTGGLDGASMARLLLANGTFLDIRVTNTNYLAFIGRIVTYAADPDVAGAFVLTAVDTGVNLTGVGTQRGRARVDYAPGGPANANSRTVFFVQTATNTFRTFVGHANVPSYLSFGTPFTNVGPSRVALDGTTITGMFLNNPLAAPGEAENQILFSGRVTPNVDQFEGVARPHFLTWALVDGVPTQLRLDGNHGAPAPAAFDRMTTGATQLITLHADNVNPNSVVLNTTALLRDGNLVLAGGIEFAYANRNIPVYRLRPDAVTAAPERISLAAVQTTQAIRNLVLALDENDIITAVLVLVDSPVVVPPTTLAAGALGTLTIAGTFPIDGQTIDLTAPFGLANATAVGATNVAAPATVFTATQAVNTQWSTNDMVTATITITANAGFTFPAGATNWTPAMAGWNLTGISVANAGTSGNTITLTFTQVV